MTTSTPAPHEPWAKQEWWFLGAALLIGVILRWWMHPLSVWPLGDAVHYLNQARYGPFSGTWSPVGESWWLPPLYPWLVSLVLGGSTDPDVTFMRALQVNVLLGALTPLALYWTLRPLFGRPIATWTCWLAVINPFLVGYSVTVISEPTYLLLLTLLWGALVRWAGGAERMMYLAPLLGFGLYLTRAFGIIVFPLAFVGLWMSRRSAGTCDRCFLKHAAGAWAIYLVACGLTIAKVSLDLGEFAIDGKSRYQFVRLAAPDLPTEQPDPNYEGIVAADSLSYAPATPWFEPLTGKSLVLGQARKYLLRQRRLWNSWFTAPIPPWSIPLFAGPFLLVIGAGLALRWSAFWEDSRWHIWLALLAAPLVIQPLTFVEPRYFVALSVLSLPWAGVAIAALTDCLREALKPWLEPNYTTGALAVLLLGLSLMELAPLANWSRRPRAQYNMPRTMAQVIQEVAPTPPARIFDTAGTAAYYLGAEGWVIPDVGPAELRAFAAKYGIEYLVMDERQAREKHNRPLLQFLYDQPDDYPEFGLSLLDWAENAEARSWRVYRIRPSDHS